MLTAKCNPKVGAFTAPPSNQQATAKPPRTNSWGAKLITANVLTGSRPVMREAPASKLALKMQRAGKEKKKYKIGRFKPFEGQEIGASKEQVKKLILEIIKDARENFTDKRHTSQQICYLIALIFNKRDIIDGGGERDLSYQMMIEIYHYYPLTVKKLLKLFVFEYGSLLDLNKIACLIVEELQQIDKQIAIEKEAQNEKPDQNQPLPKSISDKLATKEKLKELTSAITDIYVEAFECSSHETLAGKWAPRQGKSVDRITNLSVKIAEKLFPPGILEGDNNKARSQKKNISLKLYRQKLTILNSDSTEAKLCAKEYEYLAENLQKMPAKALSQYRYALLDVWKYGQKSGNRRKKGGHQEEKEMLRKSLLKMTADAIAEPKKEFIKAKTLQPYELIRDIYKNQYIDSYEVNPVHEAQWEVLKAKVKEAGRLQNTIVMADVSGSMQGIPMEVSISLGILISEIQTGCWANRLLTFAESPCWFKIPTTTDLKAKVKAIGGMDWGGSADLEKALEMILNLAVTNKVPKKDMPQNFIILTDMDYDEALNQPVYDFNSNTYSDPPALKMDQFRLKFREKGYEMPVIILWNLKSKEIRKEEYQGPPQKGFGLEDSSQATPSGEGGVITMGGFSSSLFKSILQGTDLDLTKMTQTDMILENLSKPRYESIFTLIRDVDESEDFRNFERWDFEDERNYERRSF